MERHLRTMEISKEQEIEYQNIEKQKAIELSEQTRAIAFAQKSRERSEALTIAAIARAESEEAEEKVTTAKNREIALRQKQIELIAAEKEAKKNTIAASSQGEAQRIEAAAYADAEITKAKALEIKYAVEAEGQRSINEAENLVSSEQVAKQVKLKLIENLDRIIAESVKPMENIDGIKIFQIDGLGMGSQGGSEGGSDRTSLSDQVVNSALKYRAQAPLLDSLLN